MSDVGSAGTTEGQLGERRLGTIHAVAQALAIGPMFSTAVVLGFVSAPVTGAGFNTALSVLVAGLGVLAIAYAISIFARQYQGAGAVYEYLVRGAHPAVGILTAGVFFMGTLFLGGGGIYLGLGILTNGFWTEHISKSNVPAWWLLALLFMALVLVLNYIGVRIAIGAMLTFAALSFTPMLILAVAIIFQANNTLAVFNPSTTSVHTVFNGVMLGILLFVGFEAAASLGEESHDPAKSIPRALIGTVGASALFYVIMSYAISIGLGQTAVEKGAWLDPAALDNLATQYIGSWFATIIDLVVILDATALALAICVTIGRGYFALGRDGLLPSLFARTSRHNTPWVGNLVIAIGGGGLILVGLYSHTLDRFGLPRNSRGLLRGGHGRLVRSRAGLPDPGRRSHRLAGADERRVVAVPRGAGRGRHAGARLLGCAQPGSPRYDEPQLARAVLGARGGGAFGRLVCSRAATTSGGGG